MLQNGRQQYREKADYTKNKGLDDKYYKDLLSKFIKQHKKVSRKDVDELLLTKLPEALTEKQKITKIGHLLSALKKAGEIHLGEKKMWEYIGGEQSSRTKIKLRENCEKFARNQDVNVLILIKYSSRTFK